MGFSTVVATDAIYDTLKISLLDQPAVAEHVYPQVAEQNVVSDFNEEKGYDGAIIGRLREISATGQIEHVSYEEGVVKYGTELQAATFTIPEKMFWQDSIGFFSDLIKQFQALPEKSIEHDVAEMYWKILNDEIYAQDGKPFFSEERGNLIFGNDSILSGAGLAYSEMAMDDFKGRNGEPLSSVGAFLLTNSAQSSVARRLYASEEIQIDDTVGTKNIYQGLYPPVKWQYLNRNFAPTDNAFFQNYGSSFWLHMRSPSVRPLVAVTRLANFQSPIFEQKEADPSTYDPGLRATSSRSIR